MPQHGNAAFAISDSAKTTILDRFRTRTPASEEAHDRAVAVLPAGINRNIVYHAPYPLFIGSGDGAHLTDLDGNRYLDLIGNYTSMILGIRHPGITEAAARALDLGFPWAAPSPSEARLAERIVERVPCAERVRFTASGTEATLMAVRAARAHTGRPLIAKFEGGYHGQHDYAMVSMAPALGDAGSADSPVATAPPGIPDAVRDTVVVLPFNDAASVERIVSAHADRLAAVLIEPILGVAGIIEPEPGFLDRLRGITARHGIVLIFDEIISFRVAHGGAQELYGVTPDLVTLGKIIGGGFPIGAVAGRADIMDLFAPNQAGGAPVVLSGTFHAHPMVLEAGIASLDALDRRTLAALNAKSADLFAGMRRLLERARLPLRLNAVGSLFNIHATAEPVTDYRSSARGDKEFVRWLHLALMNEGVIQAPRGMGCLSVPMTAQDADFYLAALERGLRATGALD